MNAEHLIKAIGNINEQYILLYNPNMSLTKKNIFSTIRLKWVVAACLAFIASLVALYFPFIGNQNSSLDRKIYIFSSYDEFSETVPDETIIKKLVYLDGIELEIYGTLKTLSTTETTKVSNYTHFDIEVKDDTNTLATIMLKINDTKHANSYIESASLEDKALINGIPVFYTYNEDMKYWDSVVIYNNNAYNIHYYHEVEEEFIQFITTLFGE